MDAKTNEELVAEYQAGDQGALAGLYKNNLGIITRFAGQQLWRAKTHELDDLIQVGFLGMVKAADKFDATLGWKFISYAGKSIYQTISRAISTDALVKIPTNHALVPKRYLEDYKRALATQSYSADAQSNNQYLREPYHTEAAELVVIKREELLSLRSAIAKLSDQQQHVIDRRFYHRETLQTVGRGMGLTKERVRQIQVQATDELRGMLE